MENKKNVLVFINSFWNNGKGMSGGDQMFIQVFKRIRAEFDKIFVYTNIDGKVVIEDGGLLGVELCLSNKLFDRFNIFINYICRTLKAISSLKLENIDIVYSTSDFFPDVVPAYLYKMFNKKSKWFQCVFHIYPDWRKRPGNKFRNYVAGYLQKISLLLIKKADCIVNINTQVKEYLIRHGFEKDKIVINTPGIDVGYFEKLSSGKVVEKYDAVFLARLNPSKGVNDLIDIWNLVVKKNKIARLAIVGGGSDEIKNKLRQRIIEYNLSSNINILGFLEDKEAFTLIKNSKVFIFPSHEEGFGIAIAEAMACNAAVVAWDLPVYKEIFEDNIILVEENNHGKFAERVVELLDNENTRTEISKRANVFVCKYDWREISKKHLEIISRFSS